PLPIRTAATEALMPSDIAGSGGRPRRQVLCIGSANAFSHGWHCQDDPNAGMPFAASPPGFRTPLHVLEGRFLLLRLNRGLACGRARDRNSIGRARHVVESEPMAGFYAGRVATVLSADSDLELLVGFATAFHRHLHEVRHPARIEFLERILFVD